MDEEREPHFLMGRNRASARDFDSAIDSFEKALEVNPHSAAAHFELGWLYEKTGDNAAAIYHYERFLRYRPNSDKADLARSHITSCKTELAKTVSVFGPLPQAGQRDLERLMLENRDLRAQLSQWQAFYASSHAPAATNPQANVPAQAPDPPPQPAPPTPAAVARSDTPQTVAPAAFHYPAPNRSSGGASSRSYTVKAGDIPSAIARRCGISVAALLAANPGVRPSRMQPGQVLRIPLQ